MLDDEGLETLSEAECRELLATSVVGRVGVLANAHPSILPVTYRLLGHSILFFTGPGVKLQVAAANSVIPFEVDRYDEDSETGSSVVVVGVASEVTDPARIESARRLGVRPWAAGDRGHLVCLEMHQISGRRIVAAQPEEQERSEPGRELLGQGSM